MRGDALGASLTVEASTLGNEALADVLAEPPSNVCSLWCERDHQFESELEDAEGTFRYHHGWFYINANPENRSPSCLQFHLSTEGVTHIEKALVQQWKRNRELGKNACLLTWY